MSIAAGPPPTATSEKDLLEQARALVPALRARKDAPSAPPSAVSSERAPLSPRVRVRVAALGANGEAGFFQALDQGYFQAEGLDVELVPLPTQ